MTANAKRREDALRSESKPPLRLAKRISDDVLRLNLPDAKKTNLASAIHSGFGVLAGALYGALQPRVPFLSAGMGKLFWLLADEIGMPVMGLSRPSQDYPWQTHAACGCTPRLRRHRGRHIQGTERLPRSTVRNLGFRFSTNVQSRRLVSRQTSVVCVAQAKGP